MTTCEARSWLASRGASNQLLVERVPFSDLKQWSFDQVTGDLVHQSGKFFRVQGARVRSSLGSIADWDQPIIDQPEIGILGIIAHEFDGVLHFLMQAKMEPGNVDGVQLTPTVQATRSNYTQVHRGARPPYVEYFLDGTQSTILVDQLQVEQGSAFLGKRNRNIVVEVAGDVPVGEEHRWLTLGQVKQLLRVPNLVSMDARTVLSCIPFVDGDTHHSAEQAALPSLLEAADFSRMSEFGTELLGSMLGTACPAQSDKQVLKWLTDLKGRHYLGVERIAVDALRSWRRGANEIGHDEGRYFRVMAVRVEADNREVAAWDQPLVEPTERGLIALVVKKTGGGLHVLVQAKIEAGNLDVLAVGPTVQCTLGAECVAEPASWPPFLDLVLDADPAKVRYSCVQSEEGGRFFHMENEYRVVEIGRDEDLPLPKNYLWITLRQLNGLLRRGLVNVEARNLMACLQLTD